MVKRILFTLALLSLFFVGQPEGQPIYPKNRGRCNPPGVAGAVVYDNGAGGCTGTNDVKITGTELTAGSIQIGADVGLKRSAAGVLFVTDGSDTGVGYLSARSIGVGGAPTSDYQLYLRSAGGSSVSVLNSNGWNLDSTHAIRWGNGTNYYDSPDIGLARASAGILKVTNGSTGGGQIQIGNATAAPTCDSTTRGTFWHVFGATDVKDDVAVCAKAADNSYAWRTIY